MFFLCIRENNNELNQELNDCRTQVKKERFHSKNTYDINTQRLENRLCTAHQKIIKMDEENMRLKNSENSSQNMFQRLMKKIEKQMLVCEKLEKDEKYYKKEILRLENIEQNYMQIENDFGEEIQSLKMKNQSLKEQNSILVKKNDSFVKLNMIASQEKVVEVRLEMEEQTVLLFMYLYAFAYNLVLMRNSAIFLNWK